MSEYIMNMETQKLELHFDKADYMALSEDLKKEVKSNFLFSRKYGAWVSRAKFPNLWRAEAVAKKIGLVNGGKSGETLTFAEQMERKAEKAEARAERYDYKSEKARDKAETLQKPINDMHGDIAFFTQPNINSSGGRAFTNRRNKMFSAWERGFDEFKKSEYYAERAETARQTAAGTKPTDKGFIDRRIKDLKKILYAIQRIAGLGMNVSKVDGLLRILTAKGEEEAEIYQLRLLLQIFDEYGWKGSYSVGNWSITNDGYDLYIYEIRIIKKVDYDESL